MLISNLKPIDYAREAENQEIVAFLSEIEEKIEESLQTSREEAEKISARQNQALQELSARFENSKTNETTTENQDSEDDQSKKSNK